MKKFLMFLLRYVLCAVAFLVVTVALDSKIGFVKAFETAFIFLLGLIAAELVLLGIKLGYKMYKKSKAKAEEKAKKAAEKDSKAAKADEPAEESESSESAE